MLSMVEACREGPGAPLKEESGRAERPSHPRSSPVAPVEPEPFAGPFAPSQTVLRSENGGERRIL